MSFNLFDRKWFELTGQTSTDGSASATWRTNSAATGQILRSLSPMAIALLVVTPGLIALGVFRPPSPDLFAQLGRAATAQASLAASWWTSWYGGITTPSYSTLVPYVMKIAGVWTVGIVSSLVTVVAATRVVESYKRPRLAVALASVGVLANLASGRVTFSAGLAFATVALVNLRARRQAVAAICGALSGLASPLAAFFLALVLVVTALNASMRRLCLITLLCTVAPGLLIALAFPLPGEMPMGADELLLGLAVAAVAWLTRTNRFVRVLATLLGLTAIAAFVVPSPMGGNVLRLPMLFAASAIAATSRARRLVVIPIVASLAAWPAIISAVDIHDGSNPSTKAAFFAPLVKQLPAADRLSYRIEVADSITHGASAYLAPHFPLARGWERQVDFERNPLFYDNSLSAGSYRTFLDSLAVKWVAVPNVPLDYASRAEAQLITQGLPYLTEKWHSGDWTLYEVANPSPLISGPATIKQMNNDSVVISSPSAGSGEIKLAYTPHLTLGPLAPANTSGTVSQSASGKDAPAISYSLPAAGTYVLKIGALR